MARRALAALAHSWRERGGDSPDSAGHNGSLERLAALGAGEGEKAEGKAADAPRLPSLPARCGRARRLERR